MPFALTGCGITGRHCCAGFWKPASSELGCLSEPLGSRKTHLQGIEDMKVLFPKNLMPALCVSLVAWSSSVLADPTEYGDAPAGLQSVLSRAMANEPAERYASAEEFFIALQAMMDAMQR